MCKVLAELRLLSYFSKHLNKIDTIVRCAPKQKLLQKNICTPDVKGQLYKKIIIDAAEPEISAVGF